MLYAPGAAWAVADNASLLAEPVGEKEACTPGGSPDAVRITLLSKPPMVLIAIVEAELPPNVRFKTVGEADKTKSGAMTVKVNATVWVRLPEVPVTVML